MSPYISLRNTNTEQKVCTDKKCYYRVKRLAYSLFFIFTTVHMVQNCRRYVYWRRPIKIDVTEASDIESY